MSDTRPISEPGPISSLTETPTQHADRNLKPFGWAPGSYSFTCRDCPSGQPFEQRPVGDKRAWRCRDHAIIQLARYYSESYERLSETSQELIQLKEVHDKRVSELIRAASREVIRRREINAHRMVLLRLVFKLRDQLRFYARNHRAKGTIDADQKAQVNDTLATECDEAIMFESPTGAMGTP